MMGIDVNRVIAATFFIGSALAGAAGVFNGLVYQQVWPYMGFTAGLKAFTAAVIGGIGNLPGAVVGGLAIGLAESFTIGYVSSTFSDAIVFVVLIGVMILRPSGLLGRASGAEGLMSPDAPEHPRPPSRGSATTSGSPRTRAGARRASGRSARSASASSDCRTLRSSRRSAPWRRSCRSSRTTATCIRVGFDTLIYMLLALGLNIVVGLRRAARPRLRRVLRLRRLRLRDARLEPVRPALADARDPGRRRPARPSCSGCSSRCRRAASSATTSRS